jgi:hypothetical protein
VAVGKKGYKLRLTIKAYKLSHNYINYIINLVGRSFGKWRRSQLFQSHSDINVWFLLLRPASTLHGSNNLKGETHVTSFYVQE